MKKKKNFFVGAFAIVGLAALTTSRPTLAQQLGINRTELKR